jgi:hypothetical protein
MRGRGELIVILRRSVIIYIVNIRQRRILLGIIYILILSIDGSLIIRRGSIVKIWCRDPWYYSTIGRGKVYRDFRGIKWW